jgi:hypothetical protein
MNCNSIGSNFIDPFSNSHFLLLASQFSSNMKHLQSSMSNIIQNENLSNQVRQQHLVNSNNNYLAKIFSNFKANSLLNNNHHHRQNMQENNQLGILQCLIAANSSNNSSQIFNFQNVCHRADRSVANGPTVNFHNQLHLGNGTSPKKGKN